MGPGQKIQDFKVYSLPTGLYSHISDVQVMYLIFRKICSWSVYLVIYRYGEKSEDW